jgi:molybdenum cofactor biosynthesis protein B
LKIFTLSGKSRNNRKEGLQKMSETSKKHKSESPGRLRFAVFTCSTSRYNQSKLHEKIEDVSGDLIETLLRNAGNMVAQRDLIPDDSEVISKSMKRVLASPEIDGAVFCGGTGITSSDLTIETVAPFLEKTLPGFGEIFRRLSFDEIGSAALLSRALAGVVKGKAIFCLPGSPNAVRLCMDKLVLPEASHIVKHSRE